VGGVLRRVRNVFCSTIIVAALSACGGGALYDWQGYNAELLSYYQTGDKSEFAERLSTNISKAESKDKVPPGLYAEYGYIMLELDDTNAAIEYFNKEKEKWPESAFLMDKVIARLADY
jgi:hypothetical protein